jgi:hypothetical protein
MRFFTASLFIFPPVIEGKKSFIAVSTIVSQGEDVTCKGKALRFISLISWKSYRSPAGRTQPVS